MTSKHQTDIKKLEKMGKGLGDLNRIRILSFISEKGVVTCTELMETIKLAQPSISHHIKTLVDAGLINTEKDGRFVRLSINREQVEDLADFLKKINRPI